MYSKMPIRLKLLLLHVIYTVFVIVALVGGWLFVKFFVGDSETGAVLLRNLIIWDVLLFLSAAAAVFLYAEKVNTALVFSAKKTAKALKRLAEGDLDVTFKHKYEDEMGELVDSLNLVTNAVKYETEVLIKVSEGDYTEDVIVRGENDEMFRALRKITRDSNNLVSDLRQVAAQLASAAHQVAGGAQNLAEGAGRQAAAVASVKAHISDVRQSSVDCADAAKSTLANIESYRNIVASIAEDMYRMREAMAAISESSDKVTNVVRIIDDIAFQTNILALNAAVEAARAGQHGKGFAIVADEVRALSTKSADAAKETDGLIHSSVMNVKKGSEILENTDKRIMEIRDVSEENMEHTRKLNEQSHRQYETISEINESIRQFSDVIQSNAAMAQESSAAAQQMSAQATHLNEMLRIFKI